jgi:hypothetical protein
MVHVAARAVPRNEHRARVIRAIKNRIRGQGRNYSVLDFCRASETIVRARRRPRATIDRRAVVFRSDSKFGSRARRMRVWMNSHSRRYGRTMYEEIMYPVCPHRNVPAAFERFLGPDSGGIERFFPDERPRRADGTLLIVRLQGRKALAGVIAFHSQVRDLWLPRAMSYGRDAALLISFCATLFFASRPARLST